MWTAYCEKILTIIIVGMTQICKYVFECFQGESKNIVCWYDKPCILNFGEMPFSFLFFVLFFFSQVNQILFWQNFARQFAKMFYLLNLVSYITCNLVLTAKNVFVHALLNIPLFSFFVFEIQGCHLSDNVPYKESNKTENL